MWTYIAQDDAEAADRRIARIHETCGGLGKRPATGRSKEDLGEGSRTFPVGTYIIFYRDPRTGSRSSGF
ncbi:MAG: type II toxin-antitoxin system RelE/ParE family toxin [Planctomycetes bacterium]|nr:type II toxin-antitoxin system RelE/ParE family toxin [Planctomycetota bacterium]